MIKDQHRDKDKENEMIQDMEYLIHLLEKEWGYSKKSIIKETVLMEDAAKIGRELGRHVDQTAGKAYTFRNNLKVVKKSYILLRLAEKIKDTKKQYQDREEFQIELDIEEWEMFKSILLHEKNRERGLR